MTFQEQIIVTIYNELVVFDQSKTFHILPLAMKTPIILILKNGKGIFDNEGGLLASIATTDISITVTKPATQLTEPMTIATIDYADPTMFEQLHQVVNKL